MLQLPNNCRAGNFSVFPKNWKTVRANARLTWRVSYWFYDDNLNQKKKIVIKGMNHLQTAGEKRDAMARLLDHEKDIIDRQGYNHITFQYAEVNDAEISGFTPFADALTFALKNIHAVKNTKADMQGMLRYFKMALEKRYYHNLPVKDISRKHIKLALLTCGEIKIVTDIPIGKTGRTKKGQWTPNTYNNYRKYLSALFTELLDLDAVEQNPVLFIKKQKTIKKIRETLTEEQRKQVDEFVYNYNYHFWRLMHIFFHSGARETEMLAVNKSMVDINKQRFKVLVKKGKQFVEIWKPIKNIVLDLWKEVYNEATEKDFLFSRGLKPGANKIRAEQITRRWRRHVKQKLGITADFYSLKHSNLDDIAKLARTHAAKQGIEAAQKMAGHTTPVITMTYLTGEALRNQEDIREADNTFSSFISQTATKL